MLSKIVKEVLLTLSMISNDYLYLCNTRTRQASQ